MGRRRGDALSDECPWVAKAEEEPAPEASGGLSWGGRVLYPSIEPALDTHGGAVAARESFSAGLG